MTTAVCFDLDGTLVQLTKPYATLLDETFEARLDRADPAWTAHYNERFFEYLEAIDPEPYRQAMIDLCEAFDLSADPTQLTAELREREFAATALEDTAYDAVTALSDRTDLSLGIITNGVSSIQREKLARTNLDDAFDTVVVSYDVGAHKPDKRIFAAARNRLDADRYVMIGDDYEGDIVGAREAGFEAIHVRTDDRTVADAIDRMKLYKFQG